ncbi:MAG: hypothetical protein HYV65_02975 [Candidatus Spechtbacteria bacterium]|nr:hypothetical protein [Candidatus Spechtbacteria bacterium]
MGINHSNQAQPLDWEQLKTKRVPTILGILVILLIAIVIFLSIPLKKETVPSALKTDKPSAFSDKEKQELLQQLSASKAGEEASQLSDKDKQQLLKDLSVPSSSTPVLTDEEKKKLLESLSAQSK